ncbi:porphobilinogen deaminase [Trichonephila clavata]|uniref:hydroxymethylbilane synthase n=1 Tax=Trichonephila clavata TaxID=2740835 RepID=A0A8X6J546_TRICU|nr:porphobilinogen deaminase [Trichonephila clavata]
MNEVYSDGPSQKKIKVDNGSQILNKEHENGDKLKNVENGYQDAETVKHENTGILKKVRIGSRKSQLALFQTNFVADLLKKHYSGIRYEIVSMSTTGDKILDVALSKIGEKSLFTKELEVALEKQEVQMVVHSLKDLPTTLPSGMVIGAICKRENPFDVVVFSPDYRCTNLKELPDGSIIGTSSLRRIAQLKKLLPKLRFENIRGNLNTRFRKLDEDKTYAALILAAAGVIRLDLEHRIQQILTSEECLYAVGQGALAIECKDNDFKTIKLLSQISDEATTLCCIAERAFMKALEGGCSVPIGVCSKLENQKLKLKGGVFSLDGSKSIIEEMTSAIYKEKNVIAQNHYAGITAPHLPHHILNAAENLGKELAKQFLKKGAGDILKEARTSNVLLPPPKT